MRQYRRRHQQAGLPGPHLRPAVFLIEMITVLMALSLGGTLITMGVYAVMRNQRAVGQLQNRYDVTHSILHRLRSDVRAASTLRMASIGPDEQPQRTDGRAVSDTGAGKRLVVQSPTGDIVYLFRDDSVHRYQDAQSGGPDQRWTLVDTMFQVQLHDGNDNATLLFVTVLWNSTKEEAPEPSRRFDLALRCAGIRTTVRNDQ